MTNGVKTTFDIQGLVGAFVLWFSKMLPHAVVVLANIGYRFEHQK